MISGDIGYMHPIFNGEKYMEKKLDCTALQCPAPVLQTKELLEKYALTKIDVRVDNDAAVENISRFLSFNGFEISVDSDGRISTVTGHRSAEDIKAVESKDDPETAAPIHGNQKILVVVSSAQVGKGDDELGGKLMGNFIKTLKEMGHDLWQLVFVNHGVILCTRDAETLEDLKMLEDSGVIILACGACLTHLGLMDKKAVGQTTNMLDIVTAMQLADKVINI